MPPTEEPLDLDFVLADTDAGDFEELTQPVDRDWSRLRRARVPLAVGAGLVVVAALAARIVTTHGGGPDVAARSAPSPSTMILQPEGVPGSDRRLTIPVGDSSSGTRVPFPSGCPAHARCVRDDSLPGDVIKAVRAAFPGADQVSAKTVQYLLAANTELSLAFRQVTARADHLAILIQIHPVRAFERADAGVTGRLAYTDRQIGGYSVRVQITLAAGQAPPFRALAALASDAHLLALS